MNELMNFPLHTITVLCRFQSIVEIIIAHFVTFKFRIDEHGLIKVADFGLSEDIYLRNYFRQGKEDNAVKLPFKWMALESLQDGILLRRPMW